MVAAVAPMPIASRTRLVAVLSENAIMSRTASRSVNVAPAVKWLVRTPEPGYLVLLLEDDHGIHVDLLGGGLAVDLDHDRKLDQARRRHDVAGLVSKRLARPEMLDRHGNLALVRPDQGHDPRLESRRCAGLGLVRKQWARQTDDEPQGQQREERRIANAGECLAPLNEMETVDEVIHGGRSWGCFSNRDEHRYTRILAPTGLETNSPAMEFHERHRLPEFARRQAGDLGLLADPGEQDVDNGLVVPEK